MKRLLENRCLLLPHRFLDSAFGLARNDRFGVLNDPEVTMSGPPSALVADDCHCRCSLSLTAVAVFCRCLLPLPLSPARCDDFSPGLDHNPTAIIEHLPARIERFRVFY